MDQRIDELIAERESKEWISLEFFPPRTEQGVKSLHERIGRLKQCDPLFVDFTWGAGGSTSELTMELTMAAKNHHGVTPNMHLTCTNMPVAQVDTTLAKAKEAGIRNILALRGDAPGPLGSNEWTAVEGGFACALDLIRHIRSNHGDYFCISVSGYPEGHPDKIKHVPQGLQALSESEKTRYSVVVNASGEEQVHVCRDAEFEQELTYLKQKVDAGANVIVTQMFFDPEVYGHFVVACRARGINVPILPGIMCLTAYGGFKRMASFCKTRVPPQLLERIEAVKDSDEAIRELGIEHGTYMCRRVLQLGGPGLHFYTLNLETVCVGILRRLGKLPEGVQAGRDADANVMAVGTITGGTNLTAAQAYKIADITLADYGKREIDFAKNEMRGLHAARTAALASADALRGLRISASMSITAQTAVLVETLHGFNAVLQIAPGGTRTTQDHAAAALVDANQAAVFAWNGQTLAEYWECVFSALKWPQGGPDAIIDEVGDLSLLIHTGFAAEEQFVATGSLFNAAASPNEELAILYDIIGRQHQVDPQFWHQLVAGLGGSTALRPHRLLRLEQAGQLKYPAIRLDTSVIHTKIGNVFGPKHSLIDWLMRATDVMLAGKQTVVCGFGDVGKGCAKALKAAGANVYVTEVDPICALQAAVEGFRVVTMASAVAFADMFITTTNNLNVINETHFGALKNNCVLCNISDGAEIDVAALQRATTTQNIKPGVDRFIFPDGRGVIVLAAGQVALSYPAFIASMDLAVHFLALVEIAVHRKALGERVHHVKKQIDEQVAALHADVLGLELTELSAEQADYIGVTGAGPFKPDHYRY